MNLAPTSSTTVALAFGDALAVCASEIYGFNEENFALFHPAGSLGKKLLYTVGDIMHTGEENPVVGMGALLRDAILVMSKKALGIVNIVDGDTLKGVFTDGDLRRALSNDKIDVYTADIDTLMSKNPMIIQSNVLAVEALKKMNDNNISALPVVDNGILRGTIRINDIISSGIVL